MDVPSWQFLIFACVAALAYNFSASRTWRSLVLLVTNLLFLASFVHSAFDLVPYVGFMVLGMVLIRLVGAKGSGPAQAGAIILMILIFFWLKQYTFLPKAIFITTPYLLIGLSYVFFRVLHLVIDAREDETVARISLLEYLNYTLNFTSLISGPIQRYDDYRNTATEKPLPLGWVDLGIAVERIITGLFKIMVVTVALSAAQRAIAPQILLESNALVSRATNGMMLAALFPVYLYFNFSGYTDFVIGIARLFRIRLPENFNRPFTAPSFIEYWNRWHMSLSNWLKTYVYNPLLTFQMRRISNAKLFPYAGAVALFVTFFLIGAWHGRTANFLFFGVLNGAGVAINQAYRIVMAQKLGRKRFAAISAQPIYLFFGRGLTFSWVAFTLMWFWSDWGQLIAYARAISFGWLVLGWINLILFACVILEALKMIETPIMELTSKDGVPLLRSRYVRTVLVTVMVFGIVAVQSVTQSSAPDVVYKDF